jgi:mRNA interferase MazF
VAGFVKGDVVVVPFPFSDLSAAKRRPALVLATLRGDDLILCQITSRDAADGYSHRLQDADFLSGGLMRESWVRPNRLFTAESAIILRRIGRLKPPIFDDIIEALLTIFRG